MTVERELINNGIAKRNTRRLAEFVVAAGDSNDDMPSLLKATSWDKFELSGPPVMNMTAPVSSYQCRCIRS